MKKSMLLFLVPMAILWVAGYAWHLLPSSGSGKDPDWWNIPLLVSAVIGFIVSILGAIKEQ